MVIRHAGFLMKERRIEPLLSALARVKRERPDIAASLRVEFAGRYADGIAPEVPAELADLVAFGPALDPDGAWDWMQDADVLLLVEARMKEGIFFPSKLSEYLVAGRPILALSPRPGVVADVLAAGGGVVAPPEDSAAIAAVLLDLHDRWHESRLADLVPGHAQQTSVQADAVVPVYEQAFLSARPGAPRALVGCAG
jgi:glycosyltransferase involved in cell wall biosynthesis